MKKRDAGTEKKRKTSCWSTKTLEESVNRQECEDTNGAVAKRVLTHYGRSCAAQCRKKSSRSTRLTKQKWCLSRTWGALRLADRQEAKEVSTSKVVRIYSWFREYRLQRSTSMQASETEEEGIK